MTNQILKNPERHVVPTETILKEILKEKELIENLNGAIGELESTAVNLEQEIINKDTGNDKRANKWRERYHRQVRINEQMEKQRITLKEELESERAKITNGWTKYPFIEELDDSISVVELQRLVRQLEMVKYNVTAELNDLQWKLDQESKTYHQYNDMCHVYKLEISTAKSDIMKSKQIAQEIEKSHGTLVSGPFRRH